MNQFVRAAQALSDPTRVRVLYLLMQRECCVCEVMDVLGISQVNASRYCNTLKDAGFLTLRREGRWKHYFVDVDTCPVALRDMLAAVRQTAENDEACKLDKRRLASARRRSMPENGGLAAPTAQSLAQQPA
jgi:ArsR family transcriptional regulator